MAGVGWPVKRVLLTCVVVVLAAAGCTSGTPSPSHPSSPQATTSPPGSPTLQPTTSPSPPVTVQVWFVRGGKLFESSRAVARTPAIGRAAVLAALAGPSTAEQAAGVSSRIGAGTTLTSLTIANGIARVTLSSHAESDPLSDAQVVYTLSQFPTVQRVVVNAQEGGPLSRRDLAGQLPAITVATPRIGTPVASPVTISGTADVFEATVSIRILDQHGARIADTFATATCGTGCRGDYSKDVSYSVSSTQPGTVVVFEASAETGRPTKVVRIPVILGT